MSNKTKHTKVMTIPTAVGIKMMNYSALVAAGSKSQRDLLVWRHQMSRLSDKTGERKTTLSLIFSYMSKK